RVRMLAGAARAPARVAERAAHARNLVRGDAHTDAVRTDDHADLRLAGHDCAGDTFSELGVVDALRAVRAKVVNIVTEASGSFDKVLLQFEAGVVGAEGNDHGFRPGWDTPSIPDGAGRIYRGCPAST